MDVADNPETWTIHDARERADSLGRILRNRDAIVRKLAFAGLAREELHRRTGLARSTIDRILSEGDHQ